MRETRSYTSAVVNAIDRPRPERAASQQPQPRRSRLRRDCGGGALALATVEPRNRRTAAITPQMLAMVGRALCRSGEIIFDMEVRGGRLTMLPASAAYVTTGSGDRRTWIYTVTVDGPGSTMTVYVAGPASPICSTWSTLCGRGWAARRGRRRR